MNTYFSNRLSIALFLASSTLYLLANQASKALNPFSNINSPSSNKPSSNRTNSEKPLKNSESGPAEQLLDSDSAEKLQSWSFGSESGPAERLPDSNSEEELQSWPIEESGSAPYPEDVTLDLLIDTWGSDSGPAERLLDSDSAEELQSWPENSPEDSKIAATPFLEESGSSPWILTEEEAREFFGPEDVTFDLLIDTWGTDSGPAERLLDSKIDETSFLEWNAFQNIIVQSLMIGAALFTLLLLTKKLHRLLIFTR